LALILEIKTGPFAGRKIPVLGGQTLLIGRAADRAQFAIPHDNHMSGIHFAVQCGPNGCRVIDKGSTNGTQLNGAKIQEAILASGDEIKSGQTVFVVRIVPDDQLPATSPSPQAVGQPPAAKPSPPAPVMRTVDHGREAGSAGRALTASPPSGGVPSNPPVRVPPAAIPQRVIPPAAGAAGKPVTPVFSVMGWSFYALPQQWQVQEGFGLQRTVNDEFPSSVVAAQEHLGGISLQQFVESQISMLRQYLRDSKIEPTMPPQVAGAEETMAVDVRHLTKDGKELVYRRIYARSGPSVGVLTVTALATELPQVLQTLQTLLDSAAFHSTVIV
jgi:hypothetical protein